VFKFAHHILAVLFTVFFGMQSIAYGASSLDNNYESIPLRSNSAHEEAVQKDTILSVPDSGESIHYARHYILGPNDVVSLEFFGAPELNIQELRIPPNGQITLPGTQYLMAAGKTLSQFKDLIETAMDPYLKDSTISLNLVQSKPFTVKITGAVLNPGTYEININPTGNSPLVIAAGTKPDRATPLMSSLLLTAGGVKYDADINNVQVYNTITHERFNIDLLDMIQSQNGGDLYLAFGDQIHVNALPLGVEVNPEKFKLYDSATFSPATFPVRVYGYVRNPGVIPVDPRQSNNLNSVLMQAGGYYQDYAYSPKSILLMRPNRDGTFTERRIDPTKEDIALLPNDLIYVPERGLGKVDRFASVVGRLLTPAAILNLYD